MTPAIRALDLAGVEHGIHEYERSGELTDFGREAATALGLPSEQVFKTLVVSDGELDAVAVVPVGDRLSLKAMASALGVKRVEMCDPARAERITGYVVGGISPLGQKRSLPTVIDETAELFDFIYVSGGRRGLDVSVAPHDLITLLDADVAPIAAS